MLCGLIMAGGKGTRFWPLSTEEKPKQFLKLIGNKTMLQMTVERVLPIIPINKIFICTGSKYVDLVREQLPMLPIQNIIVEPEGRNTAPCIALSTLVIEKHYKESNIVVLPSDHLIRDEEEFINIIKSSEEYLNIEKETILTLGMTPNRAETGYGYIKYSKKEINLNKQRIIEVDKFVEKPNKEKAEQYIKDGSYLWNSGMFIWNTKHIINEIKKYIPNTYEALKGIEEIEENRFQEYINEKYKYTDAISVDYAILEKSNNIKVIPSDIGWDDVGTWRAIERYREKDINNNILCPNSKAIESNYNMAINNNKKLIMVGIENTMTVETEDSIFIVNKEYMDNLKDYKEEVLNGK